MEILVKKFLRGEKLSFEVNCHSNAFHCEFYGFKPNYELILK